MQVRDIEQGWMSLKMSVIKAAGVGMEELNRMDVFDFFILFHNLEEKAERQKISGRRG